MKIWIDGDACPNKIKEILFKAATRTRTMVVIVANHFPKIPPSPYIQRIKVDSGFDVADSEIISQVETGDLVITADIPLANEVITAGALALNPRGKLYTPSNIKQTLAIRDFHTFMRDSGIQHGGEEKISATEIRQFSNQLDRLLSQK